MTNTYDVIIIGAGAAGLMCAIEAGKRGRRVWLVDHAAKLGEKIRISGGGRCNFTNIHASPKQFLSGNEHFCKSALKQYTQDDFIALVKSHGITHHEKTLGQLFCDGKSQQIIDMLAQECEQAGVKRSMETAVEDITQRDGGGFTVTTSAGPAQCESLVIATGGLSIPKIGATKFGYDFARKMGLRVNDTSPALVPLTFQSDVLEHCKALSGLSVDAIVSFGKTSFQEGLLFTHRGLSGPSILQISSFWRETEELEINLCPSTDVLEHLNAARKTHGQQELQTVLSQLLPNRLADSICAEVGAAGVRLGDARGELVKALAARVNSWRVLPSGTEGYRTAEVTLGGVDTNQLSSKTMEVKNHPGLYFIGEVLDVTGFLGGYNFQWAWSSGFVAGQNV